MTTTTCWVPDIHLREFIEIVLQDAGVYMKAMQPPLHEDCLLWLKENGRLDDRDWKSIWELVAMSDSEEPPWVCLSCRGRAGDIWFKMARDTGYDGTIVHLTVPPTLAATAAMARKIAKNLGGGAPPE